MVNYAGIYAIVLLYCLLFVVILFSTMYISRRAKKNQLLTFFVRAQYIMATLVAIKAVRTIAPSIGIKNLLVDIRYMLMFILVVYLMQFSYFLRYDREMGKNYIIKAYLFVIVSVIITDFIHHKFIFISNSGRVHLGLAFYLLSLLNFLSVCISVVLLVSAVVKHRNIFGGDMRVMHAILLICMVPLIVNLMIFCLGSMKIISLATIAYGISSVLGTIVLYKYDVFNMPRVAILNTINNLEHGVVVVDRKGKVIFSNNYIKKATENVDEIQSIIDRNNDFTQSRYKIVSTKNDLSNKKYKLYRFNDVSEYRNRFNELKKTKEELMSKNNMLKQEIEKRRRIIYIKEKNEIARELHDSIGHYLSAVYHMVKIASYTENKKEQKEMLVKADKYIDSVIDNINKEKRDNSKTVFVNELVSKIRVLAKHYEMVGIKVKVMFSGDKTRCIESSVHRNVYRICQECMTNSLKHGRAKKIFIAIRTEDEFEMNIIDDGSGCLDVVEGNGLNNIAQRVERMNGYVNFCSFEDCGFNVYLSLPLKSMKSD